jgi:hypothetical protein
MTPLQLLHEEGKGFRDAEYRGAEPGPDASRPGAIASLLIRLKPQ